MKTNSKKLTVELAEKSYPIYISSNILRDKKYLDKHIHGKQVMIVSNTTVAPLYLDTVCKCLEDYELKTITLKDGEKYKNLDTVNTIFDALLEAKFDRSCTLIALGGGVVGDITGFAAASYQRGVNFIQIPTTLLAQVDSSVGGKTGVNHKLGKNMIGAFYQPKAVIIDTNTLKTLNDREFAAGMAEVIKYGLLGNVNFLKYLEDNILQIMKRQEDLIIDIVYDCCKDKANIVAQDQFEKGTRALLNFGHTFAHAIENICGYGYYLHGEAVAIGMLMAARMSQLENYINKEDFSRILRLIKNTNLPDKVKEKISVYDFIEAMRVDKKSIAGNMRLILLKNIGKANIYVKYSNTNLKKVLSEFIEN